MASESKGLALASSKPVAIVEESQKSDFTALAGTHLHLLPEASKGRETCLHGSLPLILWYRQDRPGWLKKLAKRRKSINK